MKRFIGIDLGTSAVKVLLLSEEGIEKTATREYDVFSPAPNYSEQNPADWYAKTMEALGELLEGVDKKSVVSISFSGQMHGLVMLDRQDSVIRPAILWNDGRSTKEVSYLNNIIGKETLLKHTGNIAFAGFTAPKLLWVKENERDNFEKISKVMLPKDYLAYMMSGVFATDVSDASGTLYFDVRNRCWSDFMLDILGIKKSSLPKVFESFEVIGSIKPDIADALGLCADTKIVIGGGDNACSAVGTGTVKDGMCNISLGTSGTVYIESATHSYDKDSAIHAFCSANGSYHYLACILSAASAQKWWIENILNTDYTMSSDRLGKSNVIFLPYLTGERSPINNPEIKALFYGMTPVTTQADMTVAVLEGVAFALKQNVDIIRSLGVQVKASKICGGGTKNKLWLQMIADILDVKLEIPSSEQGGALGAALLSAKGVLDRNAYTQLSDKFYGISEEILPSHRFDGYYLEKYEKFLKLQSSIS